jgi:cytidine deaminase
MLESDIEELINAARAVQGAFKLSQPELSAASVGAALRTSSGAIRTGVCADLACGLGFCAEHAAIAEMLKHREVDIVAIVAVDDSGILSPCGRCRELIAQLTPRNADTKVVLQGERVLPLRDLLPEHWLVR